MKKAIFTLTIVGAILIGIFFISSKLGLINFFRMSTSSNEPSLKTGSMMKASNLKEYKKGDFIIYKTDTLLSTHRLIATQGDIIEIKKGIVYVNNINIDKKLKLAHLYKITNEEYNKLLVQNLIPDYAWSTPIDSLNFILTLEDDVAIKNNLDHKKYVKTIDEPDSYIVEKFNKPWNKDYFGPVKVPKEKVFVLGDNRDNSMDSRYLGFINTSEIKGTLLR